MSEMSRLDWALLAAFLANMALAALDLYVGNIGAGVFSCTCALVCWVVLVGRAS